MLNLKEPFPDTVASRPALIVTNILLVPQNRYVELLPDFSQRIASVKKLGLEKTQVHKSSREKGAPAQYPGCFTSNNG